MSDIQVSRGYATPEELAALVVVLMARSAASQPLRPSRHHTPNWHRLERALRHSGARGWSRERGTGRTLAASSPGRS
ncbi:acyl-CoA carboxylase subunit epsilon [Streptomyces sp. NPDC049967]|nr:acyl-CoA carboxylase subunit epsilon [Streptomyces sp. CB02488]WRZ16836.1 acyl-CoA carboxylase subunit epsilon [Streptomyces sp. NBC_00341]